MLSPKNWEINVFPGRRNTLKNLVIQSRDFQDLHLMDGIHEALLILSGSGLKILPILYQKLDRWYSSIKHPRIPMAMLLLWMMGVQILSLSSSNRMQGLEMEMESVQMQLLEEQLDIQQELEEGSVWGGMNMLMFLRYYKKMYLHCLQMRRSIDRRLSVPEFPEY